MNTVVDPQMRMRSSFIILHPCIFFFCGIQKRYRLRSDLKVSDLYLRNNWFNQQIHWKDQTHTNDSHQL